MRRNLLILPFFVLLMAQSNQNQLGIREGIVNFFEAPIEYISNLFGGNTFKGLSRRTLASSDTAKVVEVICSPDGRPLSHSQLQNVLNLAHITCQCGPWGSCSKEACACEKLCPKDFNIFKRPPAEKAEDFSGTENSLAFRNGRGNASIVSTQGYCWGHAVVTSRFNRLAFFKGEERAPFNLDSPDNGERAKALRFYRKIIDKIVANKPMDIPGFRNLYDLSAHPDLGPYIADKVARQWADKAMSWQGLFIALKSKPQGLQHNQKIFDEVKKRLSMNMQPNIVFTYKNQKFNTHATLVSHASVVDGKEVLCIRDNNWSEALNRDCAHYMYINEDGAIKYKQFYVPDDIGGITIAFNDERDATTQAKRLIKRCQREKGCR